MDGEDYSQSRPLATIEHLGEQFHVVRRRLNGKTWRGYLTLAHKGKAVTSNFANVQDPSQVEPCVRYWRHLMSSHFPDTDAGRDLFTKGLATVHGE